MSSDLWTFPDLLNYGKQLLYTFWTGELSEEQNITGLERLSQEYLGQLQHLNNYIFTTGSTNSPGRLFQPMWLTGYLPLETALRLGQYLRERGIYYIIQDEPTKEVLDSHFLPDADLFNPKDLPSILKVGGMLPVELHPFVYHLFYGPNRLVSILIEDPILERRSLYHELVGFFETPQQS